MSSNDFRHRLSVLNRNQCNCNKHSTNGKKRRINDNDYQNVIDIKDSIVTNFSQLYLSSKFSDITIKVDNESIACHKSVLGSQSDFFDRLFDSQMLESKQSVVELKETDPQLFRLLLKLTYFGEIDLQELDVMVVIKLFGLIQRYQFNRFEEPFLSKIETIVNKTNVWQMFTTSCDLQLSDCLNICFDFLDHFGKDVSLFECEHFLKISMESLKTLLAFDSISFPEIQLFLATKKWLETNEVTDSEREELIACIRFTLIEYPDIINIVSKSDLVSKQHIWQILEDKASDESKDKSIMKRAFSVPNTDLCTDRFKFAVVEGSVGDLKGEDVPKLMITKPQIVVKFGFPFYMNNILLKMSDIRGDRFSYRIESSVEGLYWKPLYDYISYTTSNLQKLYFEPTVIQWIRICGTHQLRMDANTKTSFASIKSMACFYDEKQLSLPSVDRIDGLMSNEFWIRTGIQQRVYHDSNTALIDGGQQNGKYYSRLLSSNKPIVVALDQPVMIDSFEFILWDRDDRAYSYIVEIKDGNEWIKLADKSCEECRSLQTIAFTRRPISLVRVKGVKIHFVESNEFRIIKFNFPKVCITS